MQLTSEGDYWCPWSLSLGGRVDLGQGTTPQILSGVESKILYEEVEIK